MFCRKRDLGAGDLSYGIGCASCLRFAGMLAVLLILLTPGVSPGGIPEPGIVLYGKVFDNGVLVTSGELVWTFTPTAGGDTFEVSTQLDEIQAEGGPYSYRVQIPLASEPPGSPPEDDALVISDTPVEYQRTAQVTRTGLSLQETETVILSSDDRGTFENINIGVGPDDDTDEDGMPDAWEQAIVDADPHDGLASVGDVLWSGDADGDGETNWDELQNGTDPTDATSVSNEENAYAAFHFEIYRGAVQPETGDPQESFRGARLLCWPPDGKTITDGILTKPQGTAGTSPLVLDVDPAGDEASMEETQYASPSALMSDYVSGEYRVILGLDGTGGHSALWFKIQVPAYTGSDFPGFLTVTSPAPGAYGVSVTPLLEFGESTWDYVEITSAQDGARHYLYFMAGDLTNTHQVDQALDRGTAYILGLDTNRWGDTWLGSLTTLQFTTLFSCVADMDTDGDVDALDLLDFAEAYASSSSDADLDESGTVDAGDVSAFADDYGKRGCEIIQ